MGRGEQEEALLQALQGWGEGRGPRGVSWEWGAPGPSHDLGRRFGKSSGRGSERAWDKRKDLPSHLGARTDREQTSHWAGCPGRPKLDLRVRPRTRMGMKSLLRSSENTSPSSPLPPLPLLTPPSHPTYTLHRFATRWQLTGMDAGAGLRGWRGAQDSPQRPDGSHN